MSPDKVKSDETTNFDPKFDKDGLIPAIAQDATTQEILMMAWMDKKALRKTIESGQAHYWSRSRQELWHKGASSGNIQIVKEILIDCDQDTLILKINQTGQGACHTGRKTCFYRKIENHENLVFCS